MTDKVHDPLTERLEKVNDDLWMIQKKGGFIFGTDSIALCDAVTKNYTSVLDLGTGSGIIPLILLGRGRVKNAAGLELQPIYADLARRNARLNGQDEKYAIIEGDMKAPPAELRTRKFDLVVSNPPYIRRGSGRSSPSPHRDIARMEIHCDMGDICRCASGFLETGGDFVIVHRADRLASLMYELRKHSLEPKELIVLTKEEAKPAPLIIIKAKKDSGEEMKITTRKIK